VFQGILPYSAQVLLAAKIAGLSPMDLVGKVHYCYFLGLATLVSIFFGMASKVG
jgi:Na+/H+ antiporter NhaC